MGELEKIVDNYAVQERSRYQIEKFVLGQHDTPEMQYRQILIEAQDLYFKILSAENTINKLNFEIEELEKSQNKKDYFKAEDKKIKAAQMKLGLEGAISELNILEDIFKTFPKYTAEDIENNQEEYWAKRLLRQAGLDRMAIEQGIGSGNLSSLINAGIIENYGLQIENHLKDQSKEVK